MPSCDSKVRFKTLLSPSEGFYPATLSHSVRLRQGVGERKPGPSLYMCELPGLPLVLADTRGVKPNKSV